MSDIQLNKANLHSILEDYFFDDWSIEEVSDAILQLNRDEQDFVLNWVVSIAQTQSEIALQFALRSEQALQQIGHDGAEHWIKKSLDTYFKNGLYPAVQIIKNLDEYVQEYKRRQRGLSLEKVRRILENFIHGLNGRSLSIKPSDTCYTDTSTLFLPELVCEFDNKDDNFILLKALAVYQWAQTWFGTWQMSIADLEDFKHLSNTQQQWFEYFECMRLSACIKNELPGLWRQIQSIEPLTEQFSDADLKPQLGRLKQQKSSVYDSLKFAQQQNNTAPKTALMFQGQFNFQAVHDTKLARLIKEKELFRLLLAKAAIDHQATPESDSDEDTHTEDEQQNEDDPSTELEQQQGPKFDLDIDADSLEQGVSFELELNGEAIPPSEDIKSLIESIFQDHGDIPEEYLVAAGSGAYHASKAQQQETDLDEVWKGTYHEEGAFIYDEWDYTLQSYKKNWCALREKKVKVNEDDTFVADTLQKYQGLAKTLRRTFEAMRDENKILKHQPDGENLDIDALVESFADMKSGMEMSSNIYAKAQRADRNIAVIFMIDMSGSTQGWINTAQRESLVLLSEALQNLGDRYAIYGFSGMTRKRCELFPIKLFSDDYDSIIKDRIAAIEPQDYTRMGVTIRHLTTLLADVEAKTKLLITISDGKPDDYDSYHGEYGIEDTRMALFEARMSGIHPFCITIDEEAGDYLPHMYGHANYTFIDDVQKLPYKLTDIYRKLTKN